MGIFDFLRPKKTPEQIAEERIQNALATEASELDLGGLGLSALPETIGHLSHIQELHLSRNQLSALPESIGQLTQLQTLWVLRNQLSVLPESLGQFSQLQYFDVSHNQLSALPESIGQLSQLEKLDVSVNKLSALPGSIGRLCQLEELNVAVNQLSALPESIGRLSQLHELHINDNRLRVLPETIGGLSQLKVLDVSSNLLGVVPDAIGRLGQVRILNLSNNQLSALPESIGNLKQLRMLGGFNNRFIVLPDAVGRLNLLQVLAVEGNQLVVLPESLQRLELLKELYLHGNNRLGIPVELLGPFWEEVANRECNPANPKKILDYYFRTRGGSRPLNEAKLILVGRGEAGKTCVVNRLVRDVFEDTSKTDGISITQWPLRVDANEDVRLHIWDFGGQEIMHATHQFFLSQRSLYLLVLNGRQGGEDADAEYWMQLIESFGADSPVIVVLNKIQEHAFDLNRRALQGKYPSIRAFIRTDCQDRTGIDELKAVIERETDALKDLRVPFPASWVSIKERLSGMAERGENFVSFEKYRDLCAELGEKDSGAQEALAGYLHSLGIALNYKDDPRLHDTHVLSPHWVTNGIYKLLNWPELEARKGVLRLGDLARVLDAKAYPNKKHVFILDLMKKFEICFEFPSDPQHRYLVTELLDKQEPAVTGAFAPEESLNFQYHYNILPEGLLPRFIVRTHALSEGKPRWRTGVVLGFEGNQALVKADVQARKVFISVKGPVEGRRRLLAVIRSDFERIHADIKKLEATEMVPVPGRPELTVPYEELRAYEAAGDDEYKVVIDKRPVRLSVRNLLTGVDIEGSRRRRPEAERQMKALNLFYSYSHKDETLRNELETHLKLLQRQGLISAWHDRKIVAGTEWSGQIDRNLELADIILLLISADSIASDYCYENEMNRALERHKEGTARVVPVILRDADWHSALFGKLQALPKDGKAVTLWQDKDSAWKDVAVGIRKAVEEIRAARKLS